MSNELIHEVEEAVRQEKLKNIWKEYGSYIIAGALLTVLFTGLFAGWRSWDAKVNRSQTTQIIQAMESENPVLQLNQIMAGLRPGHRTVSHFTAAGLLLEQGNREEALMHYQQLANGRDIDPVFKGLATLMAVRLEWDMTAGSEDAPSKAQTLLSVLVPLMKDGSPWQYHAHLEAAVIKAHGFGNYREAKDHLSAILTADGLPKSLTGRARSLDHVYTIKMGMAENEKPAADEAKVKEEAEG